MTEVTLSQMLDARENRAEKQKDLLCRFGLPVISFTMNIAGPVKTSPLIERSFSQGIRLLRDHLPQGSIACEEISTQVTGCEALFSVNCEPHKLKQICIFIEESVTIGRLFDMDVICPDGKKLERNNLRNCFVCGAPGRTCAAGRVHPVDQLQKVTKEIMENYFFQLDKEKCADLAVKSLLDEVYTTPKPGLVDRRNNGSHADMDVSIFEKSAHALRPYFTECFAIGKSSANLSPTQVFPLLRSAGIMAEKTMFNSTGGINTHKGIIYSMGILCASIGKLWRAETPSVNVSDICTESANIVKAAALKDFEQIDKSTAGGRLYLKYGLTGIRGEAASGFESVLKIGLPCYKNLISKNVTSNDAGAITLLHLVSIVKDTNLYHRGGVSGADFAVKITKNLLENSPIPSKEQIQSLDDEFIKRNLSPGGCADLLAITYFLYSLETQ